MIRPISEIQTQTRESIENFVREKIENASKNRLREVTIDKSNIPKWLLTKLSSYGYQVEIDNSDCIIGWGHGLC